MRHWINLLESVGPQTVLITDLYDYDELQDESELLSQYAPPMDWDKPLTVKTMTREEMLDLKNQNWDPVVNVYKTDAMRSQRKIVSQKKKSFDENRIIVTCDNQLIDGYHHFIAAYQLGKLLKYVALAEYD
jgi:hypothetical protein